MLEEPHERVELLKAGLSGKKIEELYILVNNFKIVGNSLKVEPVDSGNKDPQNPDQSI